jgi:soluble lytic murein transglycosylase-like protein
MASLVAAHHISDPNRIFIGQVLVVASGTGNSSGALRAAQADPWVVPGQVPDALTDYPDRLALRPIFRWWSATYGVPADLVEGLAWMESGWQSQVRSRSGAIGIGQLEPSTVNFIATTLLHQRLNPWSADDNIRMTARFVRYLLDQTGGDVALSLAGYYQGLSSVAHRGPYRETVAYVVAVLTFQQAFRAG